MLSVIIPTLGRADVLPRALRSVLAQLPADAELCIVDQSDPPTRSGFEHLADPRVRHLTGVSPGLPAARNVGLASTSGRIVLFLDDDVVLHPGCLRAHLATYQDPTVGGVVGRIVEARLVANARSTCNRVGRGGRIVTRLDGPDPVDVETLKGANMSFLRRALQDAGGFDPGYGGSALLEDADASTRVRRAGWRLRYAPDAAVDHLHHPTGGVRQGGALATECWRFHNTARFVRIHRGPAGGIPLAATFSAIAVRRALDWRRPSAPAELLRALWTGWHGAADAGIG